MLQYTQSFLRATQSRIARHGDAQRNVFYRRSHIYGARRAEDSRSQAQLHEAGAELTPQKEEVG
jgi:hypothetical protein